MLNFLQESSVFTMGSSRTVPPCSLQVMMLEPRSHSNSPVFEVSIDFSRSSSPSQCSGMLLLTELLSALNLWVAWPDMGAFRPPALDHDTCVSKQVWSALIVRL
ncbi:hypothetical protein F2Q70_00000226 [Brassica cretica]|uniref:Uncharacterized protein n=1 Tax=Brassica cretica TaxID=69181 RepID=A0A8S9IXH5_BRACR|nr:hypothetical protein F2Q70_00000226 [Brassica cretica]